MLPLVAEIVTLKVPAAVPGLLWPPLDPPPPPHDAHSRIDMTARARAAHAVGVAPRRTNPIRRHNRPTAHVSTASNVAIGSHGFGIRNGAFGLAGGVRSAISAPEAAVVATVTVTVAALDPLSVVEAA